MALPNETVTSLAMALVESSREPLLLLDDDVMVIDASASFCNTFNLDPTTIANRRLAEVGAGEWDVPQLNSLLLATMAGAAQIEAYEMDLVREGKATCRLILSAHKLDYFDTDRVRVVLAATEVTATRLAEKQKDDLIREKHVLLQELQHRVANSLQIIASVLMQSAKRVQSEETRLQKQLAVTEVMSVELRTCFADLCRSIAASMIDDPQRLTLDTVVDGSTTNSDISVRMGLIVTELVINAIKHGFADRATDGKITLSFTLDEGAWLLTVSDNGCGMPIGKEVGKPGLGTGIVEALSTQLDASVLLVDTNPGTRVEVRHVPAREDLNFPQCQPWVESGPTSVYLKGRAEEKLWMRNPSRKRFSKSRARTKTDVFGYAPPRVGAIGAKTSVPRTRWRRLSSSGFGPSVSTRTRSFGPRSGTRRTNREARIAA